jgi:DNA invertase Pin-like site-specific DNA recombinase
VYHRQAAAIQTVDEYASLNRIVQAQREYALHLGWSPERVMTCAEDGVAPQSGMAWQRLLKRIEGGKVGIVLCADISRLCRSTAELRRVAQLFDIHRVLLALDGQLVDFSMRHTVSWPK